LARSISTREIYSEENILQSARGGHIFSHMTKPLALVFYERLLPGTQLVNRLQDLGYRVQVVNPAGNLGLVAADARPLLVFADLQTARDNVGDAIAALKKNPATQHLPVIAFAPEERTELADQARAAGAIAVGETALLEQLPQLLDQALTVE
jgi:CheY-like chemotaxis protein